MKTPMQELIEQLEKEYQKGISAIVHPEHFNLNEFTEGIQYAMRLTKTALEKEKEAINKAYEMGSRDYPIHLKEDYYNETFNTKEK